MFSRSLLRLSFASSLVAGTASAQEYTEPLAIPFGCQPPDLSLYKVPWNSPTTSGAFSRTVVGNFDGRGGPDILVRRGFAASLMPNIATEEGNLDLPVNVMDMACLPGCGTFGGDAIAVVNPTGLRRVSYDAVHQVFQNTLLTSSWAGARQVVARDVDGDGLCDLLGLSSDYLSILRMQQTSPGTFVPATELGLGGVPIRVLRTLEWDGDLEVELALVTQIGWGVWNLDGSLLHKVDGPFVSGDTLAVIGGKSDLDRLAHCGRSDPLSSVVNLTVLRPDGQLDTPVALGDCRGVTLAAADLRNTGYDDLVANSITDFKVLRIKNQRTDTHPDWPDFLPFEAEEDRVEPELEGEAGNQPSLCAPLVADLDVDGRIDFACAFDASAQASGSTYTLVKLSSLPRPFDECGPLPILLGPCFGTTDYVEPVTVHRQAMLECPPVTGPEFGSRLFLTVSAHAWGVPTVNLPAGLIGGMIDVAVYRRPLVAGAAGDMEATSIVHVLYTVGQNGQVDLVPPPGEGAWLMKIEIPLPQTADEIESHAYFFQVGFLPSGESGNSPTYVGSFTGFRDPPGNVPGTNPYYLAGLSSALWGIDLDPIVTTTLCNGGLNQRFGAMAPQTRIPRLPSGAPPQPAPIQPAGSIGVVGPLAQSIDPPPYGG